MRKTVVALIFLLLPTLCSAASNIYKYTDQNGVVHITTSPLDPSVKYKLVDGDYGNRLLRLLDTPDSQRRILQLLMEPAERYRPEDIDIRHERSRKYHGKRQ
jgi:hypothetical protein